MFQIKQKEREIASTYVKALLKARLLEEKTPLSLFSFGLDLSNNEAGLSEADDDVSDMSEEFPDQSFRFSTVRREKVGSTDTRLFINPTPAQHLVAVSLSGPSSRSAQSYFQK